MIFTKDSNIALNVSNKSKNKNKPLSHEKSKANES